ncbi:MAG: PAS domain S-box protein [Chloroflexi bacterium]|nr:PAS domain S-box protein [Chloroflexota bacterium]
MPLRSSNQFLYRALFEQNNDAVFLIDLNGCHLAVNHQATALFGYTTDELVGLSFRQLVVPEELPLSYAVLEQLRAGATLPIYERRFRRKDGSLLLAEVNVALVRDSEGNPLYIQSILRDITERRRMEEAVRQSEARYRSLVETQTELVCRYLPDTTLVFVNEAYCRCFGGSSSELIGTSFLNLIPAEQHSAILAHVRSLVAEPRTTRYEHEAVLPSGERRWQLWVDQVLVDERGQVVEIQAVGRDITELKQTQLALAESEQRLQSIFDSLQDMVYSVFIEDQPRLAYINPAVEQIYGRAVAEFYANPRLWYEAVHPDDRADVASAPPLDNDHPYSECEYRILRPDGDIRWLYSRAWLVRDGEGRPVRLDGISTDITARRIAQQQAFALALETERVNLLSRFIQMASHEFRTPLSIINSSAFLMSQCADPVRREGYAERVETQVMLLTRLVDMLVKLSKLDNAAEFDFQPGGLNLLLRNIASGLQPALLKYGLSLQLELDGSLPNTRFDYTWMKEGLEQILDNAVRYTPAGGRITVRTRLEADNAVIEVEDTGAGITPEAMPRIFERFYRTDIHHTTPGFGLGLTIAQRVIEQHGGTIEVDSQPGAGTTFRLVLPHVLPRHHDEGLVGALAAKTPGG